MYILIAMRSEWLMKVFIKNVIQAPLYERGWGCVNSFLGKICWTSNEKNILNFL